MTTETKRKAKREIKTFRTNIDMKWSLDIVTTGRTAGEAKKKAWTQFKRRCPRNIFELLTDPEWF